MNWRANMAKPAFAGSEPPKGGFAMLARHFNGRASPYQRRDSADLHAGVAATDLQDVTIGHGHFGGRVGHLLGRSRSRPRWRQNGGPRWCPWRCRRPSVDPRSRACRPSGRTAATAATGMSSGISRWLNWCSQACWAASASAALWYIRHDLVGQALLGRHRVSGQQRLHLVHRDVGGQLEPLLQGLVRDAHGLPELLGGGSRRCPRSCPGSSTSSSRRRGPRGWA